MTEIELTYLTQPPKRYTFEQPKLKLWIEDQCKGKTLNLFSGRVKLSIDEIRNDIDISMPADYHEDAFSLVCKFKEEGIKFDTILLDPPYNLRKSREKYEGRYIGSFTKIKNILPDILSPNGRVITLGYDTVGMSKSREFRKVAICIVCHNGDHNDTLCLVEEKE